MRVARTARDVAVRTRRLNELDEIFDRIPFDVESTRSYGIVAAGALSPVSACVARMRSSPVGLTDTVQR